MKRRLLTTLIFLLAGALLNVAVAWGCAVWWPLDTQSAPPNTASYYKEDPILPLPVAWLKPLAHSFIFAHETSTGQDGSGLCV